MVAVASAGGEQPFDLLASLAEKPYRRLRNAGQLPSPLPVARNSKSSSRSFVASVAR